MAAKRKKMHQIKAILEWLQQGHSIRKTNKELGVSRRTIRKYLDHLSSKEHSLVTALTLDDKGFKQLWAGMFKEHREENKLYEQLESKIADYLSELNRPGVTKQLLYEEYKKECPQGYGRSQFYIHLERSGAINKAVMKQHHKPGEQMMVDFAGDKIHYADPDTGELLACEVLICTLPYSGMIYAQVLRSQKQEEFIYGLCKSMQYFGGVPWSIKCDNLKSAVIKPDRYEPKLTEAMELLGIHYQTTVVTARVYKPKDKAHVERAVNIAYQRIYAPLRDVTCSSIEQLQIEISKQVEKLNGKVLSNDIRSRIEIFEAEEKTLLKPLPALAYKIQYITMGKVQLNYHIILGADYHQYSVPYTLIGQRLKVLYTTEHVEIYHGLERVALHKRSYKRRGYTTLAAHMPPSHQAIHQQKGWDKSYFLKKALEIGSSTHAVIDHILKSRTFIEQSYNACLGILRLTNKYTPIRVENACAITLSTNTITFSMLQRILYNKMDMRECSNEPDKPVTLFLHENVRGAASFDQKANMN